MSLIKEVTQEELQPVYLIHGTETFVIDDAVKKLSAAALNEEDMDYNLVAFDLEETDIQTALAEAETGPFLGDKKVVICKKAIFLSTEKGSKIEHDLKKLEAYIKNPAPYTVLILVADYEKLDKRKKITKQLLKEAALLEAKEADARSASEFLRKRAGELNVSISPNGSGRLMQMVGNNLTMLDNELNKMAMFVGKGKTIDEQVVDELVSQTLEQSVFVLVEHVVKKKHKQSYSLLQSMFKQNEEPIKILALITRQIRIMLQLCILEEQRLSQGEMAKRLKLHPYAVKVSMQQKSRYSIDELMSLIEQCAAIDHQMKSGKDQRLLLELFVTEI